MYAVQAKGIHNIYSINKLGWNKKYSIRTRDEKTQEARSWEWGFYETLCLTKWKFIINRQPVFSLKPWQLRKSWIFPGDLRVNPSFRSVKEQSKRAFYKGFSRHRIIFGPITLYCAPKIWEMRGWMEGGGSSHHHPYPLNPSPPFCLAVKPFV